MSIASAAIIGGGIAGLTCGNTLKAAGYNVTVFEKARGPGGRTSTRRAGDYNYDHGAPFFRAYSSEFKAFMERVKSNGYAHLNHNDEWTGTPRMNAITKYLAGNLDVTASTRIQSISGTGLLDTQQNRHGPFDWIVIAVPAAQAQEIVPEISGRISRVEYAPLKTLMLTLAPGYRPDMMSPGIEKVIPNASKPERPEYNSYVVHSTESWAMEHLEADKEATAERMIDLCRIERAKILHYAGHRWLYGNIKTGLPEYFILNNETRTGFCGDWFCDAPLPEESLVPDGVERAYLSGSRLAAAIIDA